MRTDILAAVPGSDPDTVRRLIREVCGKWAGPNGKAKSAQHVVDEVIRLLRASDATSQAEKPGETIVVGKPTNSAKEDAAKFAALRKQMTSARPPTAPRTPHLQQDTTDEQNEARHLKEVPSARPRALGVALSRRARRRSEA